MYQHLIARGLEDTSDVPIVEDFSISSAPQAYLAAVPCLISRRPFVQRIPTCAEVSELIAASLIAVRGAL